MRLTGLSHTIGRLEVFFEGKWGTICSNVTSGTYLGYGKTVCSQLNHYDSQSLQYQYTTGTVNSLNTLLANRNMRIDVSGGTSEFSMFELDCDWFYPPGHILRCVWKSASHCRNHDNDLALMCMENITNWDNPYPGQIRLNNTANVDGVNKGILEVYGGEKWGNVCYDNFDDGGADTACRQLGYTNAKTFSMTRTQTTSTVWLSGVSCGLNSKQCLWECLDDKGHSDFYHSKSKSCEDKEYVSLECVFNTTLESSMSSLPLTNKACLVEKFKYVRFSTIALLLVILTLLVVVAIGVSAYLCCTISSCPLHKYWTKSKYYEI